VGSSDLDELGNGDESEGGVGRGLDPDQLRKSELEKREQRSGQIKGRARGTRGESRDGERAYLGVLLDRVVDILVRGSLEVDEGRLEALSSLSNSSQVPSGSSVLDKSAKTNGGKLISKDFRRS